MIETKQIKRVSAKTLVRTGVFFFSVGLFAVALIKTDLLPVIPPPTRSLETLTRDVTRELFRSKKTRAGISQSQTTKLHNLLESRQREQIRLLTNDPQRVLKSVLPKTQREQVPVQLQSNVEQETTQEGRISVIHGDDFEHGTSKELYFLEISSQEQRELVFGATNMAPAPRATVRVSGYQIESSILVGPGEDALSVIEQPTPLSPATTTGTKKVAAVLFNFQNDTSQPFTVEYVRQLLFDNPSSLHAYYEATSFNQLHVVGKNSDLGYGDVYGWVTINLNNTGMCWSAASQFRNAANQMVGEENLSGYDNIVYIIPEIADCQSLSGWAELSGTWAIINGHRYDNYTLPSDMKVVGHEFGHNLGASHAHVIWCDDPPLGGDCAIFEYGDRFDIMGNGGDQMSASRKWNFGWLQPDEIQTATLVGTQTYLLYPSNIPTTDTTKVKLLRIASLRSEYFLEYRRPALFMDPRTDPDDPVYNGLSIRLGSADGGGVTQLIHVNPGLDLYDGQLLVGQTFNDPNGDVSITVQSQAEDKSYLTVAVTLTCTTSAPPNMSITSPWGYLEPGTTKTYALSIRNNNFPQCGPSPYTVTPTLTAGWQQSPPTTSMNVNGMDTGTATFTLTSPATAADGQYFIEETIFNPVPELQAIGSADYWIDSAPPAVSISSPTGMNLPISGTVQVESSSTDANQIYFMKMYFDDIEMANCQLMRTPPADCTFSLPITDLRQGYHEILVTATDAANRVGQKTLQLCYPYTSTGTYQSCGQGGRGKQPRD